MWFDCLLFERHTCCCLSFQTSTSRQILNHPKKEALALLVAKVHMHPGYWESLAHCWCLSLDWALLAAEIQLTLAVIPQLKGTELAAIQHTCLVHFFGRHWCFDTAAIAIKSTQMRTFRPCEMILPSGWSNAELLFSDALQHFLRFGVKLDCTLLSHCGWLRHHCKEVGYPEDDGVFFHVAALQLGGNAMLIAFRLSIAW